jgi:hypothetical protein
MKQPHRPRRTPVNGNDGPEIVGRVAAVAVACLVASCSARTSELSRPLRAVPSWTATLVVHVLDTSGAEIAGADVTVTIEGFGAMRELDQRWMGGKADHRLRADSSGMCAISLPPHAHYRLTVKSVGFRAFEKAGRAGDGGTIEAVLVTLEMLPSTASASACKRTGSGKPS